MANITFSEASGLQDSIFSKSQAPIKMFLESRGEAYEQRSVIKDIFDMESSTHYGEKFTTMTAMDGFQPVGELGAYPVDGVQEGYSKTLEHMVWKDSFSLSREIIDDTKIMDLKKRPEAFISGYYRTREKFGACLLGNAIKIGSAATFGGRSFDVKSADGQTLFSKTHPSKVKGGNQSNYFADAFSIKALNAMETAMQNFKGDNGEILDVAPDTILIPNLYSLKYDVFSAIGAEKSPDTANNGFNYQYGRWNVIVWPDLVNYITAESEPWVLLDSRYCKTYGGAIWLDRVKLEVRSTLDENTDANVWRGYSRFIAGFNDWRFAAVGGVTSGTTLVAS